MALSQLVGLLQNLQILLAVSLAQKIFDEQVKVKATIKAKSTKI